MSTHADLLRRAHGACRDGTSRRLAFLVVLLLVPTLLLGASLWQALSGAPIEVQRPLDTIASPLTDAYHTDHDLGMVGYLALQLALLALVLAWPALSLHRRMAVDIATGAREDGAAAGAFARANGGSFVVAALLCRLAFLVPLLMLFLLASFGLVPVVLALSLLLLLIALRVGGGLHPGSAIAVDGLGALAAWRRTFSLARSARLGARLSDAISFLPGFLVRLGVTAGLAALLIALLDRSSPLLAVLLLVLVLPGLADLLRRVVALRIVSYLERRDARLGIATSVLGVAAERAPHRSAEAAGFVEVGRIE